MNLLQETIEILKQNGKSENDVLFVMDNDTLLKNTWEWFKENAKDIEYDEGYGHEEINCCIKVVGKDFWLERNSYDGSEWWNFKSMPEEPENVGDFNLLDSYEMYCRGLQK